MNKTAIFTIIVILAVTGLVSYILLQARNPGDLSSDVENTPQEVAGRKVDTTGWGAMEDEQKMFSMQYPPSFKYLKSEMDKFGTAALCREDSNWQAVLKDKTGKTKLANCLVYIILPNEQELDTFSTKFYNDKVAEAGGKDFTSEKDVVLLGENAWLRQAYKEETSGKEFYTYISLNDKNQAVVFDLTSMAKSEHESVHDVLSTLKFFLGEPAAASMAGN